MVATLREILLMAEEERRQKLRVEFPTRRKHGPNHQGEAIVRTLMAGDFELGTVLDPPPKSDIK